MYSLNISRKSVLAHNCLPQKSYYLLSETKDAQEIIEWRNDGEFIGEDENITYKLLKYVYKASTSLVHFVQEQQLGDRMRLGDHKISSLPYHQIIFFFENNIFSSSGKCSSSISLHIYDHVSCHKKLCQMLNLEHSFIVFNIETDKNDVLKIAGTHTTNRLFKCNCFSLCKHLLNIQCIHSFGTAKINQHNKWM